MNKEHLDKLRQWYEDGNNYAECSRLLLEEYGIEKSRSAVRHLLAPKKKKASPVLKAAMTKYQQEIGPQLRKDLNLDFCRILVISDMHVPFQHPDTVAFLTAVKAEYKPTHVVCIGDEVDHHAMSFHDSDPDLFSAGDELQEAIKQLQPIYKLFPYVSLVDSNHGSMAYRKGKHHGTPRKYLRSYGEVLDAPKGWVWQNDLTIDLPNGNTVYFHHGISKDVMKVVALRGTCVVQGHYHTEFRIGYIGNPSALLWGMNVGCLINGKSLAFAYDNTNLGRPVIGCGIILDGQPKLLPMVIGKDHKWDGVVP